MIKAMFDAAFLDLEKKLPSNTIPAYRVDIIFCCSNILFFYLYEETTKTYLDDNSVLVNYMFKAKLKDTVEFIDTMEVSEFIEFLQDKLVYIDMQQYGSYNICPS